MMMTKPEMMFRVAELEIDPQHLAAYRALLAEEIEASLRLEPGVLFLQALAEQENPARIRVIECYASKAAYEQHITTPHFLKYKQGTLAMVKALRLVEMDPIALAAKDGAFSR